MRLATRPEKLAMSTGVLENALRKAVGASEPLGIGRWVYPGVYPRWKKSPQHFDGIGLGTGVRPVFEQRRRPPGISISARLALKASLTAPSSH